ncbi:MAG TPA: D-tyrosyl-tRNA(Tyr) deacylase [bacterium]|nr:D-tyrosyl-tRNA(Tyr) deacylase [bacterium]
MRAVIQRVSRASVTVEGEITGRIEKGIVVLLGVASGDTEAEVLRLADKIVHLRIFENEAGRFDRSLIDVRGEALVVSQFTLYGDCRRGRRPDFTKAARPEIAEPLYERFVRCLREKGIPTETGKFAAMMQVEIYNDGPVTVILDTENL